MLVGVPNRKSVQAAEFGFALGFGDVSIAVVSFF